MPAKNSRKTKIKDVLLMSGDMPLSTYKQKLLLLNSYRKRVNKMSIIHFIVMLLIMEHA